MNVMMTELRPLCYSYVRFSTPDQIKGDSKRRQIDKARAWAKENGYDFDDSLTIRDEGKSAYKGAHVKKGNLGKFLARCEDGEIPRGSVLYVEAIDRLTRLDYWDAQDLISDLLRHVDLVVSQISNDVISRRGRSNNNLAMVFAGLIVGSNAESQRKASNLREAWRTKRLKSSKDGCLYTEKTPEWISVTDFKNRKLGKDEIVKDRYTRDKTKGDKVIVGVIPERGKIVKTIYQKYNKGETMGAIATWLNNEGFETWGGAKCWHRSYVTKILKNPAVCGTLEQKSIESVDDLELGERQKSVLENEVKDYYPRVVSPELFKSVQAKLPKGKSGGARATQNALSNLCECPKCGSTMTRVYKGKKGGIPKLVCTNRHKLGTCDHVRVNQEEAEGAMMRFLDRWTFQYGLHSLINAQPEDRDKLIKTIRDIEKAIIETNKLPFSTARNERVMTLLNERRKLELKTEFTIEISAKRFNESIKKYQTASTPSEQNANLRQIINKIIIHSATDLEVSFIGCEKMFRIKDLNPNRKSLAIKRPKKVLKPA